MYAAIRRYAIDSRVAEELARRITEGFLPIIRNAPGFVAYYVIDEGNGGLVSVSIFEDQAGAEESSRRSVEWVRQHLAGLLPNPPQISTGQVIVQSLGDRKLTIAR